MGESKLNKLRQKPGLKKVPFKEQLLETLRAMQYTDNEDIFKDFKDRNSISITDLIKEIEDETELGREHTQFLETMFQAEVNMRRMS